MKKELPSVKKSLKSFILEEDARVIDKSMLKISLMVTTFALIAGCSNGGSTHTNHSNFVAHDGGVDGNTGESVQNGTTVIKDDLVNEGDSVIAKTYTKAGESVRIEIPSKGVSAAHVNHLNRG